MADKQKRTAVNIVQSPKLKQIRLLIKTKYEQVQNFFLSRIKLHVFGYTNLERGLFFPT